MATWLQLAVTIGVLALLVWQIGLEPLRMAVGSVELAPVAMVLVLLVLLAQFVVWTWRWRFLAAGVAAVLPPFRNFLWMMGASSLYGQVLPSSVGGDVVRAALLAPSTGLKAATISVLLDRMTGLIASLAMVALTAPFLLVLAVPKLVPWPFVVALAGVTVAALFWYVARGWLVARLGTLFNKHLLRRMGNVRLPLQKVFSLPSLVSGLAVQLASILLVYLLARSVGVQPGFWGCMTVVPAVLLVTALPISISGWGVREGALVAGFALLGVQSEQAILVSVLYGLTGVATAFAYVALKFAFAPKGF